MNALDRNSTPLAARFLLSAVTLALAACGGDDGDDNAGSAQAADDGATVSGTIAIETATLVDATVNAPDVEETAEPNDTVDTAQSINNPAILGGFAADEAVNGGDRDPADFYRVDLSSGDSVQLQISDFDADAPASADHDLLLLNSDKSIADDSTASDSATEEVIAPADGEYFVQVDARAGASNYVLTVGDATAVTGSASNTGTAAASGGGAIIPGDAIVHFYNEKLRSQGIEPGVMARRRASNLGLQARGGSARSGMLLSAADSRATKRAVRAMGAARRRGSAGNGRKNLPEQTRRRLETIDMVKALRRQDNIRHAELNRVVRARKTPDDTRFGDQWHMPLINLPSAWDSTEGSSNVIVAVVDTAFNEANSQSGSVFDSDHPDLATELTGTGRDFTPSCDAAIGEVPDAAAFHGLHVAGTAAAATNNAEGVAGAGWRTRLMDATALCPDGTGTTLSVRQAVEYAAGLAEDKPPEPADIINLSLGGTGASDIDRALYREVADKGIMVVAAAGNTGDDLRIYPAAYNTVFAVGAVGPNKEHAPYSGFPVNLDLVAPGGNSGETGNPDDDVLSTGFATSGSGNSLTLDFTYERLRGTSMAAPHYAGVLALMRATNDRVGFDQALEWLEQGKLTERMETTANGDPSRLFGYGLADASAAVDQALSAPTTSTTLLRASPRAFQVATEAAGATLEKSFSLEAIGDGTLTIDSIDSADDWVSVDNADGEELGDYTLSIDSSGLSVGNHRASVLVETVEGATARIAVSLDVEELAEQGDEDAGRHFVQVIDTETGSSVAQKTVTVAGDAGPNERQYSYSFNDLDPGTYRILASTDNDNDFILCDPGEAQGTAGATVTVPEDDSDVTVPQFTTGYRATLQPGDLGCITGSQAERAGSPASASRRP